MHCFPLQNDEAEAVGLLLSEGKRLEGAKAASAL
jgi:hypothetical protein